MIALITYNMLYSTYMYMLHEVQKFSLLLFAQSNKSTVKRISHGEVVNQNQNDI